MIIRHLTNEGRQGNPMGETPALALFRLFHQCAHRMNRMGKYRGQGRLLLLLEDEGTLTQRALIEITGRRSATLSEQLESMEKAGWITREKNAADKRNIDLALTPLGRQAAGEVRAWQAAHAEALFGVLDEKEQDSLYRLLQKLSCAWAEMARQKEAGE